MNMTDYNAPLTFCANHPNTPTALRCNKCGKPVCVKCIVRTPVGYRCRECVRGQQQVFETVVWSDYVVAAVIAAPVALLAGALVTSLAFFSIFLAPIVGMVIAELVRLAVRRRRGHYLNWVAVGAFVAGCLPLLLLPLLGTLFGLLGGPGAGVAPAFRGSLLAAGLNLIWIGVYMVLGAGSLYARLRGIAIR
jgi:hypothetical protein